MPVTTTRRSSVKTTGAAVKKTAPAAQGESAKPARKRVLDLISPKPPPAPAVEAKPVAAAATEPAQPVQPPDGGAKAATETSLADSKVLHLKPPIVVKDLAALIAVKPFQLISELMQLKILASMNQVIEPEVARKICEKHGFKLSLERRGEHPPKPVETPKEAPKKVKEEPKPVKLVARPPVVTIMGHVDHGKTSLLDAIRKSDVVAGEAGGITQHIGAYNVKLPPAKDDSKGTPRSITFIDTPGHEAFTAMRARGANVTDIVVLVVAGSEGLMPQTLEAISHAKAANVPIMVAINKMDLEAAQKFKDRLKKQLQEQDLTPEDWGGKTIVVEVSATKKTGIDHLLEMIMLQAEMMELKAETGAMAEGSIIEAQMEPGRGPTATVLVRRGVLKVGNSFIVGQHFGKAKALVDDTGKQVKEAGPSMPVKIVGLSAVPEAGLVFKVVQSDVEARSHSEQQREELRLKKLEGPKRLTIEDLLTPVNDQVKQLKVILKTDVQGSSEAIKEAVSRLPQDKVNVDIIHMAVGPVSENDVLLAAASKALIVGFQVKVDTLAAGKAEEQGVQIQLFRIIYELTDKIREFMSGLLDPETKVVMLGRAEVKQVFNLSKGGNVAGCLVSQGRADRKSRVRIVRQRNTIFEGAISTLRRFQDDVNEVRTGLECGLRVDGFNDYQPGDIIECYHIEKIAPKL
ncbi:MAG: translation initiation factor IF-2 [Verrucomicrobiae bacterium]|nr:translation initiation factor IF-2 [Verrucomicrobiae bacterium]